MNDVSVTARSASNSLSVSARSAQYEDAIGEISAYLVGQWRETPSFPALVRHSLATELFLQEVAIPNPELLFINGKAEEGLPAWSLTLLEALFHAFVHGVDAIRVQDAAVYYVRDSVHHGDQTTMSMDEVSTLFEKLIARLPSVYTMEVDKFWTAIPVTLPSPDKEGQLSGTREHVVKALFKQLLDYEIERAVINDELTVAEKEQLNSALGSAGDEGIHTLSLSAQHNTSAPLASMFVVSSSPMTDEVTEHAAPIFLYSPLTGIERFASRVDLEHALLSRLSHEDDSSDLSLILSQEEREWFGIGSASPASLQVHYSPLHVAVPQFFVDSLRSRQHKDSEHAVRAARAMPIGLDAFMEDLDTGRRLDDFDQLFNSRYVRMTNAGRWGRSPHWLRYADPADQQTYQSLEVAAQASSELSDKMLVGLESLERFARDRIDDYLFSNLLYTFDPASVIIEIPDTLKTTGDPLALTYRHSLLEFAINGLPVTPDYQRATMTIPRGYECRALTAEFVKRLVESLDVRHNYGLAVEARYRQQDVRQAFAQHVEEALGLSIHAARLQGHLSARAVALIEHMRAAPTPESGLQIGSLNWKFLNRRLQDVIVFQDERVQGEEFYVMYAPGVPGGRDMFQFESWRQLSIEVAGWTATDQGMLYLVDQTTNQPDPSLDHSNYDRHFLRTHWDQYGVAFTSLSSAWGDGLRAWVHYKTERVLSRNDFVKQAHAQPGEDARARVAIVLANYRIEQLNQRYEASAGILSYRQAARLECTQRLSRHLRSLGMPGEIDPDSVLFDLSGGERAADPDLSRFTPYRSLTDLFMAGYSSEEYEFHLDAQMYSSIDQDLGHLSLEFVDQMIRTANFGDQFIRELEEKHTRRDAEYRYWSVLFARRTQLEMIRAALIEYDRGNLTLEQYKWVQGLIIKADKSDPDSARFSVPRDSSIQPVYMERCPIQGVYYFAREGGGDAYNLVYTPDAPDGRYIRPIGDVVDSFRHSEMPRYYYDRVIYNHQRIMGSLLVQLAHSNMVDGKPLRLKPVPPDSLSNVIIRDFETLFAQLLNHMIVDVNNRTESVNERLLLQTYLVTRDFGDKIVRFVRNPYVTAVWHGIHAGVDAFRGIYAYQTGDRARARGFFLSALTQGFKTGKAVRAGRKAAKAEKLNNGPEQVKVGFDKKRMQEYFSVWL
jgi:hypothetical protein